jgi:anti-sigma B factor antagonist
VAIAKILLTHQDGASLLTFAGDYDVFCAPNVRDRVHCEIDRGTPSVIDLRGATFIDSTIMSVLLGANRRSNEAGVPFAIVLPAAPNSPVRRIFEVTHLMGVFRVFDEPDGAVDAMVRLAQPA